MIQKERTILVLKRVVEEFVRTNHPVGSASVSGWLGVSSASVRTTMNDLLSEGYLTQPHTSAGRVPSDKGYRFFVDFLLEEYLMAETEGRAVQECLDVLHVRLDRILGHITRLLSQWCDCLAFVAVPEMENCVVQSVGLTRVSDRRVLLLVVLSNGMVENQLMTLPVDASGLPLDRIATRLNERLHGRGVSQINSAFLESVFAEIRLSEQNICDTIMRFFETLIFSLTQRVFVDGAEDIMNQPEFQDTSLLRPVLEAMRPDTGAALFRVPRGERLPEITIGMENPLAKLRVCSVIKSNFQFGDQTVGTIGLLGPKRMNYARLKTLVNYVAESLSSSFHGMAL